MCDSLILLKSMRSAVPFCILFAALASVPVAAQIPTTITSVVVEPANPNPSESIRFYVVVSPSLSGTMMAYGNYPFYPYLHVGQVTNGSGLVIRDRVPAGTYEFDLQFAPSAAGYSPSAFVHVTVQVAAPQVSLTTPTLISGTPRVGEPVWFLSHVTPPPPPDSTATYYDGNTVLGTVSIRSFGPSISAQPQISTSFQTVREHFIRVSFPGAPGYPAGESGVLIQPIQGTPSAALESGAKSVSLTSPITLTAAVAHSNNGSVVPSGTVRLLEGATPLGTAALNRQGEASWTLPAGQLEIGEHILHVSYSGDTFYDPVVSPVLIQQVTASRSATVTNLNISLVAGGAKLQALVTGGDTPLRRATGILTAGRDHALARDAGAIVGQDYGRRWRSASCFVVFRVFRAGHGCIAG